MFKLKITISISHQITLKRGILPDLKMSFHKIFFIIYCLIISSNVTQDARLKLVHISNDIILNYRLTCIHSI